MPIFTLFSTKVGTFSVFCCPKLETSAQISQPQPTWQKSLNHRQEIAANCEKYIRAKDTQVSLMIFSSEFKLVKPFVFLSFIFESTDRYNVFHMTHT